MYVGEVRVGHEAIEDRGGDVFGFVFEGIVIRTQWVLDSGDGWEDDVAGLGGCCEGEHGGEI